MKILFILDFIPYPLNSGGNQAVYNMIDAVRIRHDVSICCYLDSKGAVEGCKKLQRIWTDVKFYTEISSALHPAQETALMIDDVPNTFACRCFKYLRDSMARKIARRRHKMLMKVDQKVDFVRENSILNFRGSSFSPKYHQLVWDVSRSGFDLIQTEFFSSLFLVHLLPENVKKVYVQHEINYIRRENELSLFEERTPTDYLALQDAKYREVAALSRYNYVIALTEVDKQIMLRDAPGLNIYVSPAVVSLGDKVVPAGRTSIRRTELAFVGSGSHFPNADGILWFAKEVMPVLKRKGYDLKVNVLGKWGKQIQALLKGTDSNIVFTGYIEDISGFLNDRISIVPIRIGSGMRMKILDSIVAGSPIVTTEKGCEGLPFVDNEDYMIADSPEKFADAIIELLNDPDKQRILAENIQGKLDKQFDFEAMKSLRLSFYDKLSQNE